jgi:acetoin utilization deacetylase AcuC-like enzyme
MQHDGTIRKAMVIDTDVHHGNGTAAIFSRDHSVFTLSIHQLNNYPAHKPASTLDLNMEDGVADEEYLNALLPAVRHSLDSFQPDMVFYVGGADPYRDDQLGGLDVSLVGLKARDRGVFEEVRKRKVPVVTTLAGGYARQLADTIQIHVNTILAAIETAEQFPQALPAGN